MTTIHSVKDFKQQTKAGKVSAVSLLILPLIGLTCLIIPHLIADYLPYGLGAIMTLYGIAGIIVAIRKGSTDASTKSAGTSIVMCVLGVVILVQGEASINFIGVLWGMLGLFKASKQFNEILHRIKINEKFAIKLVFAIIELILSVLLLLNPFANFDHHIMVLGLELISYPFTIDRSKKGRITVEADA